MKNAMVMMMMGGDGDNASEDFPSRRKSNCMLPTTATTSTTHSELDTNPTIQSPNKITPRNKDQHDNSDRRSTTPSRPELDNLLDALDFDLRKSGQLPSANAPTNFSGARTVRSNGSGDHRRRARRNNSGDVQSLSSWRQPYGSAATTSGTSTDTGTAFSSLGSLGTMSMSTSLSKTSDSSPFSSRLSSDSSKYPKSAPIAWKRKGRKMNGHNISSTISEDNDDLSYKMNASFSSFGRREHRHHTNPESFHHSIENFPTPGMLNTFMNLQGSQDVQSGSEELPSQDTVSIVMSSRNEEGGVSAFKVGSKEAMIIESLLQTTRESSPTKKREAMMKWLESTASTILSPTQHSTIMDSERLVERSPTIAEIRPPFDNESPSHDQRQDLVKILEEEKQLLSQSRREDTSLFVEGADEDEVVKDSGRILDRSLTRANSIAIDRPSQTVVKQSAKHSPRTRSSSTPRRKMHRAPSKPSDKNKDINIGSRQKDHQRSIDKHENKHERGERNVLTKQVSKRSNKSKRQIFNKESDSKGSGDEKLTEENEKRYEDMNKSFIDQFLDGDVDDNDSAPHLLISPGGTAKNNYDVQKYKAALGDLPIEASQTKLRIEPEFLHSSQRIILHDPLKRSKLKKMKSVPNLDRRSNDLVKLFVGDESGANASSSKKKKSKKERKSKKESPRKKGKNERNTRHVPGLERLTLLDLPRQSLRKIEQDEVSTSPLRLQKSKSLSNLDVRAYNIEDRLKLVERLKALSNSEDRPTVDAVIAEKVSGKQNKKKKSKSLPKSTKSLKDSSRRSSIKIGAKLEENETFEKHTSDNKFSPSSVSVRKKKNPVKDVDGIASPPSKPTRKKSHKPSELSPSKPVRKVSRPPNESSPPNDVSKKSEKSNDDDDNDRVGLRIRRGESIAEGSILEVPDDDSVCSELTDIYSVELMKERNLNKDKSNKNLSSINEADTTSGDPNNADLCSFGDSMTQDKELHLSNRWDHPSATESGSEGLKSPTRPVETKKHFGWLSKKLPFMKNNLR